MNQNTTVTYSFMVKPYIPYRLRNLLPGDRLYEHSLIWKERKPFEVRGQKTYRLFAHWFTLARNKGFLAYGVVTFDDTGETWIWQEKTVDKYGNKRGGWQLALRCEAERCKGCPVKEVEQLTLF